MLDNVCIECVTEVESKDDASKLNAELLQLEKELARSKKMLSNETFIKNAKPEIVVAEIEKEKKYHERYAMVTKKINELKNH
jgi:valyl-tRNA synthetase